MTEIGSAHELLQPGETALVVFTRSNHFEFRPDGTGSTGLWKMAPNTEVDRVVIYVRQSDRSNSTYTAVPIDLSGPNDEGRYGICLENVQHVGTSPAKWFRFADTNANPIRYLSRKVS